MLWLWNAATLHPLSYTRISFALTVLLVCAQAIWLSTVLQGTQMNFAARVQLGRWALVFSAPTLALAVACQWFGLSRLTYNEFLGDALFRLPNGLILVDDWALLVKISFIGVGWLIAIRLSFTELSVGTGLPEISQGLCFTTATVSCCAALFASGMSPASISFSFVLGGITLAQFLTVRISQGKLRRKTRIAVCAAAAACVPLLQLAHMLPQK
jgi:hypothetical protein